MWLLITIASVLFCLSCAFVLHEMLHPMEETFTTETETHLIVTESGELIETAEFKIHSV